MSAAFREVFPYAGVDEHTPAGNVGIVVPLKGANVVLLADGPDLKVEAIPKLAVQVDEIRDPQYYTALANAQNPGKGIDIAYTMAMLKRGTYRIFKITGNSVPGLDAAWVKALNPRTSRVEATLKVLVLRQLTVKIAIRPVQVLDGQKNVVSFTDAPFDPQVLLQQMNSIWTPQANVVFQLGRTDPALIDGLSPKADGADITSPALSESFQCMKDAGAALTAFLVRRAYDGRDWVLGVTKAKDGFALIGDNRSPNTLAHEAGHFLGSLSESGRYSHEYGHQGTDAELLMRDGGAGRKIPFGLVPDFNKGYRKN
jgi:hypothetical protein